MYNIHKVTDAKVSKYASKRDPKLHTMISP